MKGLRKKMKIAISSDEEQADPFAQSIQINPQGEVRFIKEELCIGKQGLREQKMKITAEDLQMGDLLGRGTAGTVMKAVHIPTGRQVAVKSINVYDKEKRQQLKNDLKALQQDNDCHFLVQMLGAYFEDGSVKVVLEYMDYGSLRDLINQAKRIKKEGVVVSEQVCSDLVQQILQGLSYLNTIKKQLHRDIKPENILINRQGEVKLTDFGISRSLEDTEYLCNTFVGTTNYMSLERLLVKKYDHRSDIWSLGLLVIELITGRFYYKSRLSYLELIQTIQTSPQPHVDPSIQISHELTDFLNRCCTLDRNTRATAIELSAHPWIINNMMLRAKTVCPQTNSRLYLAALVEPPPQENKTKSTQLEQLNKAVNPQRMHFLDQMVIQDL